MQAVKHEGTTVGEKEEIAGIPCYVSYPPSKSTEKVILFCCDVFGPWYKNNQLLMDFFATGGYTVVAPDYFGGEKLEEIREAPGFDFGGWVTPHRAKAESYLDKFVPAMKEKFNGKAYGVVGYCFGGKDVVDSLKKGWATAGATCHPAFITEEALGGLDKRAIFFSCSEIDHTFPAEGRHKAEEILAKNKIPYHFQLFADVAHGFAIRGDMSDENQRWAKETSAWSLLSWFDRWLKV
ncbi:alpha/beta-hydrolase [Dacryopinax primogenitus]|uniref:Alpha/beta-hydrolase n=1 Tax=Dacryopinax primogenitus (strain DJM 731) TaxID=1858805 RepID=M5G834_DACPD|nr:alpha/beta-hydrolase [Dacryopinax primogenitus]EJU04300.1 alpha/beta-hydrolase [Dacryopinax primogenitus]